MSKKIKTEKIFQVPVRPGQDEHADTSEGILNSFQEYDARGNLILEISYNPDGSVGEKNKYSYDEQGNLTGSILYGEDDEVLETGKIVRDQKGNPVREEIVYLDGSADVVQYTYDGSLLTEKVRQTDEEEIEMKEVFRYDNGKVILYERYDGDERLVYQVKNAYDDGVIKGTEVWSEEEGEPFRQVIEYDEQGRRSLELKYNTRDKLIERNQFELDEEGRVARMTEENISRKNTTEFTYDGSGRVLRQVERDMNGKLVSDIGRSYDDEGRLMRSTVEFPDRATGLMRRNMLVYEYDYHD